LQAYPLASQIRLSAKSAAFAQARFTGGEIQKADLSSVHNKSANVTGTSLLLVS
jgi:hypothetical protein